MVVYAFCSLFLRFYGEFGQLGALSPRLSQAEFSSGSAMYLDIGADLPEVPPSWASMPARLADVGIPSKAASQKVKEKEDPGMKNSRIMKSWKQSHPKGVRSKSFSHQALIYFAVGLAPLALALSFALVFTSPGVSTA